MKHTTVHTTVRACIASVQAMRAEQKETGKRPCKTDWGWSYDRDEAEHWSGGMLIDEALAAMAGGGLPMQAIDPGSLGQVYTTLQAEETESTMQWDTHGPVWDMGSVIAGLPECALQFVQAPVARPLVRMLVDLGYSCGVSAATMLYSGRAVVGLAEALHRLGYGLEIDVGRFSSARGRTEARHLIMPVHTAGTAFDGAKLGAWLGHPAATRLLLYPHHENLTRGAACGSECPLPDERQKYVGQYDLIIPGGFLYEPGVDERRTQAGAKAWILAQLAKVRAR